MGPAGDRLDGWKEISNHLGKGVRTVQRWEQERELPIHRLHSGQKHSGKESGVYAFRAELDRWLETEGGHVKDSTSWLPSVAVLSRIGKRKIAVVTAAGSFLVVFLAFGLHLSRSDSVNPVSAVVQDGSKLLVFGTDGEVLWSKVFEGPVNEVVAGADSAAQVADLDGDRLNEVLFALIPDKPSRRIQEKLFCFDRKGVLQWEYSPGNKLRWDGFDFPNSFRLWDYSTHDLEKTGRRFTVLIANHLPYFPAQVLVLDPEGRKIGEYWNTGYIFDHDAMDVDGDGIEEIVIGGINNVYGRPFIAVLDHTIKESISPVEHEYAPALKKGNEVEYILLPRTDVSDILKVDSRVFRVSRYAEGALRVDLQIVGSPDVYERVYYLDAQLKPVRLDFPQSFASLHGRLEEQKRLDHAIDESEKRKLMQFESIAARPTPTAANKESTKSIARRTP